MSAPKHFYFLCPSCGKHITEERHGIKKWRCPECGHELNEVEIQAMKKKKEKSRG